MYFDIRTHIVKPIDIIENGIGTNGLLDVYVLFVVVVLVTGVVPGMTHMPLTAILVGGHTVKQFYKYPTNPLLHYKQSVELHILQSDAHLLHVVFIRYGKVEGHEV